MLLTELCPAANFIVKNTQAEQQLGLLFNDEYLCWHQLDIVPVNSKCCLINWATWELSCWVWIPNVVNSKCCLINQDLSGWNCADPENHLIWSWLSITKKISLPHTVKWSYILLFYGRLLNYLSIKKHWLWRCQISSSESEIFWYRERLVHQKSSSHL